MKMIFCCSLFLTIAGFSGLLPTQTNRYATTETPDFTEVEEFDSGGAGQTPTTWFVRPDGGSRAVCDGQADTAPVGTAPNQHCAFGDARYLWTDGSYTTSTNAGAPGWGWVIAGGDTVILRGGPWRIGQSGPNSGDYFGLVGNPYAAGIPPPPSGTAGQHTRILGENYANCGSPSAKTQLFGGYGVFAVLNLDGTQFVDLGCIELTRHSQCTRFGVPAVPAGCNNSYPLDDYAENGIITNNGTHDILLQDVWIHGFTSRGIIGPIGGTITANRVDIAYNGGAGWDFDDGNATPSVNGLLNANGLIVEWNGCNQAYPGSGAVSCYSQSTGGYGDGIGTPAGTCISTNVTNSIFRYNTQDGYDWLHNDTGTCPSSVTNSSSYGNSGSQFKWGPANNPMTFTGNTAIANCLRLSAPIQGQPSNYNTNLTDFCRALDGIAISQRQGDTLVMTNNTIISYAQTTVDFNCSDPDCSGGSIAFKNNIVLAYDNPATYALGGQPGGPGMYNFSKNFNMTRANNLYFGVGHNFCSTSLLPTEICADPLFVNEPPQAWAGEASLDNFNTTIQSSVAAGLGAVAEVLGIGTTPLSGGSAPPSGGSTPPSGGSTPPSGGTSPPSGGSTPPPANQQWTKVANENDVVNVPAGTTVRFGYAPNWSASITFSTATTFTATNAFFGGDPYVGQPKEVDALGSGSGITTGALPSPPPPTTQQWTKVANENDVVNVPAGTTVRFGYAPNWSASITFSTATTFSATNAFFGGDPYPYQPKEVDALGDGSGITTGTAPAPPPPPTPQQWVKVANENDIVNVPAGTTVRFGYAPNWSASITFSTATTFSATNDFFGGDPYVGQPKEVDALGSGAGITTGGSPSPPAPQQWTKVANENDIVNVPAGTTVRFGYAPNWSASITFSVPTTFSATNAFFGGDPYPNQFKEVDALGTGTGVTTGKH